MAFVTSYEQKTPRGVRIRVLCCYDGAHHNSDDPPLRHTVHYSQTPGGYLPNVVELWQEHGWGRRGKQTPVCPGHRIASDTDWPKEEDR